MSGSRHAEWCPVNCKGGCDDCLGQLGCTCGGTGWSSATCPKCGGEPTTHRHYPTEYGNPVDRCYCGPCDQEWWNDVA